MVGKAVPGGFRMQTEGGERTPGVAGVSDVRERVLSTAAELYYREGVRAVGVDLIVQRAGVAKTSLYRHFRTKDDLVEAFLKREDAEFWEHWDEVARRHAGDPAAELDAHLDWIAERIARPGYRGCPQLNVAAEFPDATPPPSEHPARGVARPHKRDMRRRLRGIRSERRRVGTEGGRTGE